MNGTAEAAPARATSFYQRALPWAVALGILLRLYHYGRNPAMWHDEAATCINIVSNSFTGLFGHLRHSATGPSLLLCFQKCLTYVLGDSTYSLRLVSVVASCLALVLFARLSKLLLEPPAALLVVTIAACSDSLLWHASEARHYSSDFLNCTILLLLFVRSAGWPVAKRAALFAVYVPFAILLSYPGIFLCAGLMLALLPDVFREKTARAWASWFALGLLVAASFAFFYLTTIRGQRSHDMDSAWQSVFPDLHKPWTLPVWFIKSTLAIFDYFLRPWAGGILIVPAAVGIALLWKQGKRELLTLILVPISLAALAALVKSYPYTGARTMVYAMPGLAILAGFGFPPVVRFLQTRLPAIPARVLIAALCLPVIAGSCLALYRVARPWERAQTDLASAYVLEHRQPTDPVTANHWEYEYYFRNLGPSFSADLGFFSDPKSLKEHRVWVVLTSGGAEERMNEAKAIEALGWHVTDQREFTRCTVFLLSSNRET